MTSRNKIAIGSCVVTIVALSIAFVSICIDIHTKGYVEPADWILVIVEPISVLCSIVFLVTIIKQNRKEGEERSTDS